MMSHGYEGSPVLRQFEAAMVRRGLVPPKRFIADGKIHRCKTQAKNGRGDGAYLLHLDGVIPAGGFENWQDGQGWDNWKFNPGRELMRKEQDEVRRKSEAAAKARREAKERDQERTSKKAARLWESARPCPGDYRYFAKKDIKTHGARTLYYGGRIVIPVRDIDGRIFSLQFISADGTKRFLKGGRVAGCMYRIDGDPDRIIIGEGFATLASIHEATGATVIIAFDAGNLLAVAEAVRKQFHDTDVIIAADDDWKTKGNPGRAKATEAARAIGARLAIPDFGANRRDKDTDFNDLANFIGPDAVRRCIDAAEEQSIDVEAEIPRLAKLSIVEYEREREQVAKRLGMRVSVLDAEVALKRDKPTKSKDGISRQHWKVEPWAEPVDLAELLDAIHGQITRYMKMPETEVVAVTLWVAHTWVFDAMDVSPYMNIRSPAPECGKSRLLKLIYFMGHRTYTTGNISPAAIFRVIDEWHPTLLIDEVDTFLKENEEARGILDAGHTRATAFVTRIVDEKGQLVPKDFSTWAPKVFCGIGEIARTLAGRSVIGELQRKKIGEKLPRLLERDVEAFADIRSKAARWAQDALPALQKADTEDSIAVPEALSDRATDNWRPLLAIADLAGDAWPGRARNAVLALSGIRGTEDIAIQLLRHIRDAFQRRDDQGNIILQLKALKTEDLLAHLTADPERPWAEYRRGKPLSAKQLGALLGKFGITSETVSFPGQADAKGYKRVHFEDAWVRYLPVDFRLNASHGPGVDPSPAQNPVSETSKRRNADEMGTSSTFSKRRQEGRRRFENGEEMPEAEGFRRFDLSETENRPESMKGTDNDPSTAAEMRRVADPARAAPASDDALRPGDKFIFDPPVAAPDPTATEPDHGDLDRPITVRPYWCNYCGKSGKQQGDLEVVHLDGADYVLHPACKGPWLQKHAATAGNAEPDLSCCERCHQSDGVIAPYRVTVSDGILCITPADGDHGVPLHSSCWFAWGREQAKKRRLRFSGWGSPQTRIAR